MFDFGKVVLRNARIAGLS